MLYIVRKSVITIRHNDAVKTNKAYSEPLSRPNQHYTYTVTSMNEKIKKSIMKTYTYRRYLRVGFIKTYYYYNYYVTSAMHFLAHGTLHNM